MDLKSITVLAGVIAGGVLGAEARYTPTGVFYRHAADSKSGFILDLVSQARSEPPGEYKDSLCKTLEEQIGQLCQDAPDHSICKDRALHRERAGC